LNQSTFGDISFYKKRKKIKKMKKKTPMKKKNKKMGN
jgi:hypothetical protein